MIILISGACGAGKTTISKILSSDACFEATVCLTVDSWLYDFIQTGFIEPWLEQAKMQNVAVMRSMAASAKSFSLDGYTVFVEGVISKSMIPAWLDLAREGFDVRYIILRPNEATTFERVLNREQNVDYPIEPDFVRQVCQFFENLEEYEAHVFDTTGLSITESILLIKEKLNAGCYKL